MHAVKYLIWDNIRISLANISLFRARELVFLGLQSFLLFGGDGIGPGDYLRALVSLHSHREPCPEHLLALPRQPVTASGIGLRREVEVGVDEPVVEVLYKGEAALRVPEVVLHVGQVDDGIEVVHQLHADFIGLNVKVLCQQRSFCIVRWNLSP